MQILKQFINGEWASSISGKTRKIINPYNQKIIAKVTDGNHEDAKKAIIAAQQAFAQGKWPTRSAIARGKIVRKIASLVERDTEKLARLESLNTGKTVVESREDMEGIAAVFHYYADLAGKNLGEIIDSPNPNSKSRIIREPVGVCAQITPWNYPLLQAAWKLAPALVTGNTLVMKPSEITPLTTIKIFELIEEAGVPAGVANLVLGTGASVGAKLAESEKVDLISFTGGVETGQKIMQAASSNMKKVVLELGGKNPNIIFADADFSLAVDHALDGVFYHAGQVCSAGTRLLIEENIHDKFVEALVKRVKKIKLGNGFSEKTEMGPLISTEHLEKVSKYVKTGIAEGATLATGGRSPTDAELQKGFFYLPTVLTDCSTEMKVVQNEGFGPVITVEKFSTEEEAIQLANDSNYGLSGGIWSQDIVKAERIATQLRMGTVWINDYNVFFAQAPWGGYKQSGTGHELGVQGLEEYTETKHIYQNTNPQLSHWFGKG